MQQLHFSQVHFEVANCQYWGDVPISLLSVHVQFEFEHKVSHNPKKDKEAKQHKDIHPVNLKYIEMQEEALEIFVGENSRQ